MCRCDREIPPSERRKIALFCNVRESAVIQALDVDSIYDVPLAYHAEGLDREVLAAFQVSGRADAGSYPLAGDFARDRQSGRLGDDRDRG